MPDSRGLARLVSQLGRFGASGAINTALGGAVILVLTANGTHYALANALGYALGLLSSFILNKYWTFESRGHRTREILKFGIVFIIAYGVNLVAVSVLVEFVAISPIFAQIYGILLYMLINFFGMKAFVFAATEPPKP